MEKLPRLKRAPVAPAMQLTRRDLEILRQVALTCPHELEGI